MIEIIEVTQAVHPGVYTYLEKSGADAKAAPGPARADSGIFAFRYNFCNMASILTAISPFESPLSVKSPQKSNPY